MKDSGHTFDLNTGKCVGCGMSFGEFYTTDKPCPKAEAEADANPVIVFPSAKEVTVKDGTSYDEAPPEKPAQFPTVKGKVVSTHCMCTYWTYDAGQEPVNGHHPSCPVGKVQTMTVPQAVAVPGEPKRYQTVMNLEAVGECDGKFLPLPQLKYTPEKIGGIQYHRPRFPGDNRAERLATIAYAGGPKPKPWDVLRVQFGDGGIGFVNLAGGSVVVHRNGKPVGILTDLACERPGVFTGTMLVSDRRSMPVKAADVRTPTPPDGFFRPETVQDMPAELADYRDITDPAAVVPLPPPYRVHPQVSPSEFGESLAKKIIVALIRARVLRPGDDGLADRAAREALRDYLKTFRV